MKNLIIRLTAITFFIVLSSLTTRLEAQVTIGSNKPAAKAALLELKTEEQDASAMTGGVTDATNITSKIGGLGLPRVQLVDKTTLEPFVATTDADWTNNTTTKIKEKHTGLTVYNITSNLATESNTSKRFRAGIYVWNGSQWNLIYDGPGQRYFFIPSANIPLADASGNMLPAGSTFDLYTNIYAAQFAKSGNSTFVSSNPTLNFVPSPLATQLYNPSELDFVITYYDSNVIKVNSISTTGIMNYDVLSLKTTPSSFINVVFVIKE